jgi:hypothetical protein
LASVAPSVLNTPSPAPGTTLGTSETFTWTAGSGVALNLFQLGTAGAGSRNLYDSWNTTGLTSPPIAIPGNGYTVYARLWSQINSIWQHTDYTFTESGAPVASVLNTPLPGPSPTLGTSETFTWATGSGPTQYDFHVGTTGPGSIDLYDSGPTTALTSPAVAIPGNGYTVYARISSYFPISNVWTHTDYTFTESGAPVASVLNTPFPAPSPNLGTIETFTWTAGSGATLYDFHVGTTGVYSIDLYDSGPTTAVTSPAIAIPSNGHTLYARISSYFPISNVWTHTDYTFTEP